MNFASLTPIARGPRDEIGPLQSHLGDQPRDAESWFGLGVALNADGRYQEAAAALHSALVLSPNNIGVECAYAVALNGAGATNEAARLLEEVISRRPGEGWAYFHLAGVRSGQGDWAQAACLWECASRLLDEPVDSLENLALALRRLGDAQGEQRCWKRVAELQPGNPTAAHMLAASGAAAVPLRADDAYIAHLFDRFAPDFDRILDRLRYVVPEHVEAWMQQVFGVPRADKVILDAGCGTGLCGERLRPWAANLVGIDLSAEMLARAGRRGVYDRVEKSEIIAFLRQHRGAFDVIVAGDVLCYFGALDEFAAQALSALRPGGRLGFSVERAENDGANDGFILQNHGRYAHTRRYLQHTFKGCECSEVILRLELTNGVPGYWVAVAR